jgi:hypothetical protein
VIPIVLTAPEETGPYSLTIGEADGPLGGWQGEGQVVVVVGGEEPVSSDLPVPVELAAWGVPASVQPGDALPVDLSWRALGKIDAYYSVYVKLLDREGNAVAGWDGQPHHRNGGGAAPTLTWVPGSTVEDRVILAVPEGLPGGEYAVEAGMYRAADLARCLTLGADGALLERVALGAVQVEP